MKYEDAIRLGDEIDAEPFDINRPRGIVEGIAILRRYDPTQDIEGAEHDKVYACDFDEKFSDGDLRELFRLGWFIDEDTNSLAHFA